MFTLLSGATRDPGHSTRNARGGGQFLVMSISQFLFAIVTNSSAWHHEMSWHQRLQEVSLYQFILMFMSISLTSKSILQSSTELVHIGCIYVYSGFVYFSLCCVFI